jgi:hypothetical protein
MSLMCRAQTRRQLSRLAAISIAITMIALGAVVVLGSTFHTPKTAAAATRTDARHGTGISIKGQWFGTWITPDGRGFCIEFEKDHPDHRGSDRTSGRVPGMTTEQSAQVKFIANKYANTRSRTDAVAASIFIWKVQNTTRFDRYYASLLKRNLVSASIRARVSDIAAEAKNHGPYKISMKMGAGLVGQSVNGVATVRAKNGKRMKGMAVSLSINSNGSFVSRATKTNSDGNLTFVAKVKRPGSVRVDARMLTASAGRVFITNPTPGRQRLVVGAESLEVTRASVSSIKSLAGPTVRSTCDESCKGIAPVTVSMNNPCGTAPIREFIYSNGKLVSGGTFDVASCSTGSKTVNLPDGAVVTTKYCYLDGAKNCTTSQVSHGGTFNVVCPPWVTYSFSGSCPCDGDKAVKYSVLAPAGSSRTYTATLVVTDGAGSRSQNLSLVNGTSKSFTTVTLKPGARVELSFTVEGKKYLLDSMTQNN